MTELIEKRTLRGWLIAVALFFLALYLLRGMLLPFVAGFALAYFLDPIADRLERAGMRRVPAVVVLSVAFALVVTGLALVLIPAIQGQVVTLIENAPGYADRFWAAVSPHVDWAIEHLPPEQVQSLKDAAGSFAGNAVSWAGSFARGLLKQGFAVINVVSFLVVTPVVTIYLLRDWDRMVARVDAYLPRAQAPKIRGIFVDIDRTLAGFVRGQATVCLCLAAIYGGGLSLVGLEAGLLVGIGTGMLSFIPYVGSITGFAISVVLALVQYSDWPHILGVAAVFGVGQTLEGYFLTPRLVGNRVGLHPVWVLFALFAGGNLFGFLGVLVALPVAAVIGVLVRHALRRYLASDAYANGSATDDD